MSRQRHWRLQHYHTVLNLLSLPPSLLQETHNLTNKHNNDGDHVISNFHPTPAFATILFIQLTWFSLKCTDNNKNPVKGNLVTFFATISDSIGGRAGEESFMMLIAQSPG